MSRSLLQDTHLPQVLPIYLTEENLVGDLKLAKRPSQGETATGKVSLLFHFSLMVNRRLLSTV